VVLDAVGIGITLIDSSIDSVANARSSLDFLQKEIESVAEQLGTIGANLSELEVATERLQNQVYLSEKGLSRVGQDALIEESTRFAKQNIKSQAATALLSQAFSISEKVLNVIL
jgi:flagellin-like hook-associated protein FlgL